MLIQIYFDKTATSFRTNALTNYLVHVVRLTFSERTRRHLSDHGYSLVEIWTVQIAEPKVENGDLGVERSLSLYERTS